MSQQKLKRNSLLRTQSVLLALALGLFFGLILRFSYEFSPILVQSIVDVLTFLGQVFIRLMKMLVVPVVFVSIVCGCSALADRAALQKIGLSALALYIGTTLAALSMALFVASWVDFTSYHPSAMVAGGQATAVDSVSHMGSIIPDNLAAALVSGSTLQVIFVASLLGICLTLAEESGRKVSDFFQSLNQVITQMIMLIMCLTPYGVFCLMAKLVAGLGATMIFQLLGYFFLVLATLLLHAFIVYGSLLRFLANVSPWRFVKKVYPAMVVAFSVASSNVALPVTLQMAKKRLGIKSSLAEFVLPLGATLNMDGTAIMQAIATVMLAQWYHVDMTLWHYITVILTALFASIGTAGVPGIGMITLAMVLDSVGIPLEGIGVIVGIDRLLDMARTVVNITGDCCVTLVLAKHYDGMEYGLNSKDKGL